MKKSLVKKSNRLTNQKFAILQYLKNTKLHPSGEMVYQFVKNSLPQISLATVYRNLKDMAEQGVIQEIPSRPLRYDGDISNHAHFICEKCQTILDLYPIFENKGTACGYSSDTIRIFAANCPFLNPQKIKIGKINKYQITIYGICKKCS